MPPTPAKREIKQRPAPAPRYFKMPATNEATRFVVGRVGGAAATALPRAQRRGFVPAAYPGTLVAVALVYQPGLVWMDYPIPGQNMVVDVHTVKATQHAGKPLVIQISENLMDWRTVAPFPAPTEERDVSWGQVLTVPEQRYAHFFARALEEGAR